MGSVNVFVTILFYYLACLLIGALVGGGIGAVVFWVSEDMSFVWKAGAAGIIAALIIGNRINVRIRSPKATMGGSRRPRSAFLDSDL
jgi:hypothetical protein